jgi:hypothetical protein
MKKFSLALLALATALAISPVALANSIYLAPQDNSGLYANNQIGFAPCCGLEPGGVISGPFGVGNTITFAGSGPFNLDTVAVDLFGYAGGGTLPIEIDLYAGTNPNTGALLGSSTVTPTGNGWTTEVLSFSGLKVPDTLTYIVSIVGNNGSYDDSFVNWQQFTGNTGAPTVGTSGDMWFGAPGSYVVDNTYAIATGAKTNTLAAQFNGSPVPEPGSLFLLGTGLLGLAVILFRKAKPSRLVLNM